MACRHNYRHEAEQHYAFSNAAQLARGGPTATLS